MRSITASFALVMFTFPVIALTNDLTNTQTHQNKNNSSSIVTISKGNIEKVTTKNEDRKKISQEVFKMVTIKQKKVKEHNEKRLMHYKPRLDTYAPPKGTMAILVTGYSSTPDQTWGNPFITASGTRVHKGTMACPPQYPFGTKIRIDNMGTYICEDRGGAIKGNHFDIWFESRIEALQWGKRNVVAIIEK